MREREEGRARKAAVLAEQIFDVPAREEERSVRRRAARVLSALAVTAVFLLAGLRTGRAFAAVFGSAPAGEAARPVFGQTADRKVVRWNVGDGIVAVMPRTKEALSGEAERRVREACDAVLRKSAAHAREYKKSFPGERLVIGVDYDIRCLTREVLSVAVRVTESWNASGARTEYFNFDMKKGDVLSLADVLGSDYAEIANRAIREEIRRREETGGAVFWTEAEGGFATVERDTRFYVNESGDPVVVYEPYEIAPGAMGTVEFEIALSARPKEG